MLESSLIYYLNSYYFLSILQTNTFCYLMTQMHHELIHLMKNTVIHQSSKTLTQFINTANLIIYESK